MTLHIYTKSEIFFMTRSFIFYRYRKVLNKGFFPSTKINMKIIINKTIYRHRDVPPVIGGGDISW